ncbi:hypothetical protein EW145_g7070 [Phellinidium pouzarii]|uniref:Uncharacterized protein n=1 Tax=Phellinidium pouzarii TaxID=167371 RepID=A0A4S4KQE8_9AGAM|nr:hypothetical protein EW145_g7070 [Phellinidium pouzarii]
MPSNEPGPLSQAVILALMHSLAVESTLWWLKRGAIKLNSNDPLISPYIPRVLPTVSNFVNTTKQRLELLPGSPQLVDTRPRQEQSTNTSLF